MVDLEYLKSCALEESKKSGYNFKHGCVIVRNGRIVAKAFNDHKGHAEHNAILALQRVLCGSAKGEEG